MRDSIEQTSADTVEDIDQFDAIIIGAGVTGLYQLYRLRQRGLSVRIFEDGSGVGGTWYWNRYPGARFDSESYTYGYSFSEELLQEWDWKEHYSGQPENERYLNYVADKFDLRRDIEFNARVASAVYDEREDRWQVQTEDGRRASGQFLIAAVGNLSAGIASRSPRSCFRIGTGVASIQSSRRYFPTSTTSRTDSTFVGTSSSTPGSPRQGS